MLNIHAGLVRPLERGWQIVSYQWSGENPQIPAILSVNLTPQGALTIDFSWDWTDRSPEFIRLTGSFADDGVTMLNADVRFAGNATPVAGGPTVMALDKAMKPVGFGTPQDKGGAPGTRYYRLSVNVTVNFAGRPFRDFKVEAQGQCHLHQVAIPGFNVSPLSASAFTRVFDATPPARPAIPEAPIWASLRDVAGVSSATLQWGTVGGVAGYVLYEATETAILSARGLSGPDTSQLFTTRLATLRDPSLPSLRSTFRRVRNEIIPQAMPSCEVTLPRGSNVIHLYAVTAMSENNVESEWPDDPQMFFAVAAPRLAVPEAPAIEATVNTSAAQPSVTVNLIAGDGVPATQFELYRMASDIAPESADIMGPLITPITPSVGKASFIDTTVKADWRRVWYRALAWSAADTQRGLIEARSVSSSPVSVVLPPASAPGVSDLRVNLPGSTQAEALISFATTAPSVKTPLGSHKAVIEATDAAGIRRLSALIDTITAVPTETALPPFDAQHPIVRVGTPASYRLYARVARAAGNQAFNIVIKVIDPLGRVGSASATVPPLPPFPPPILSAILIQAAGFAAVERVFITWTITSPMPANQSVGQHRLRVQAQFGATNIDLQGVVGTIAPVTSVNLAPPGQLRRIGNTQGFVLGLARIPVTMTIIATVTLTDPVGQTVTRVGRLN
jgi:hypothetical protein